MKLLTYLGMLQVSNLTLGVLHVFTYLLKSVTYFNFRVLYVSVALLRYREA